MVVTNQTKNQHLMWRAGFGTATVDVAKLANVKPKDLYALLEKNSINKPEYFDVADNTIKGIFMGIGDAAKMEELKKKGLDSNTKKMIRQQSREDIKNLNIKWTDEMVDTNAQLREKMSLFWHGHFACRDVNIFFQQLMLQEIRENALGNFGNLLKAISKSASMLGFLNNQQNKKQHPNENFAREVMELFTLGRGNYTETDVKEAARAFTGWGFNLKGEFQFRRGQHDSGSKTVLGKTGNFDGDDLLNILLQQKQTAYFITQKIYKYFVNENVDEAIVKELADSFYQSNYDIATLMKSIFTSDWFYEPKNIGAKIKSPVELMTGIQRLIPMEIENVDVQLLMQRSLGQILFYPPNVAGWPGGKNWIDSSSLMVRLQIPRLIQDDSEFAITPKTDDDQAMGMMAEGKAKNNMKGFAKTAKRFRINAKVDWNTYIKQFESVSRENLYDTLEAVILQTTPGSITKQTIESNAEKNSRENYIKSVTIALMSTPEYQLC